LLIRHINIGDISNSNIKLIEEVLNISIQNKEYIKSQKLLLFIIIYTYLRIAVLHRQLKTQENLKEVFSNLYKNEIAFLMEILNETNFLEFEYVGRDFIRVLNVSRIIPEIDEYFKKQNSEEILKILLIPTRRNILLNFRKNFSE
jgi:hypothetical protein